MKKITTIKYTLLAVFAGLLFTMSAQAATFTVDRTDDATVSACVDGTPNDCTLRGAIVAANGTAVADVIQFDATVFNVLRTITLGGTQLAITNNSGTLTINGTGANLLIISGNNLSTVFRNDNLTASVIINGVTIANGRGGFGGGIANSGPSGNLTMNNSVIRDNTATSAGGGFNTDGSLTLNNSTVSGNSAGGFGGGGISNGGTVTLNNSTVSTNTATNGAGIFNGTFNNGSRVTLNSSTVSNNTGNGIRNNGTLSVTTLNNSIIANSTSGVDCVRTSGTINATYSLIEQNLTCVNGTNSNNLTGDPKLGPLQNNGGSTFTHELLAGSIAIDKGNSTLTTDQRGSTRPVDDPSIPNAAVGNGSDIGAFEVQVVTAASVSISGRVSVGKGTGLTNAVVHITDQNGNIRTVRTSSFGYFRFDEVEVGQTLIINVYHRRYQFNPQVVTVTDEIVGLNFTPQ